jgi:hypothetical protein
MKLKNGILQNLTNSLDCDYGCIYESPKTRIYDCNNNKVVIVTKEYPKYLYYKFALENKYQHIPKIYDLVEDFINKVYIIRREELYPIIDVKKITRLEIVKNALLENIWIKDTIVREVLYFHTEKFKLDFGPHCFMQTKNMKIVVSDLFMEYEDGH